MDNMILTFWCFSSGGLLLDSVTHRERHQTKDHHKVSTHQPEASIPLIVTDSGFGFIPIGNEGTNEGINIITSKILLINHKDKTKYRFRVRHHYLKNPAYGWVLLSGVPVDFRSRWRQMLPPASAIQHEHFS